MGLRGTGTVALEQRLKVKEGDLLCAAMSPDVGCHERNRAGGCRESFTPLCGKTHCAEQE